MAEALTIQDIPDEYWPKCDWCGDTIKERADEFDYGNGQFKILCYDCQTSVWMIIAEEIGDMLDSVIRSGTDHYEQAGPKPMELSEEQIREIALQNMMSIQSQNQNNGM